MQSYNNAERGLSRVNKQVDQNNKLTSIFHNRWVMIGGAVGAAAPLLVRLSGSVVQLVGSLVQAAGGAGVVGGGALGAFIVGIGSVMLVVKVVGKELKTSQQAFAAYNLAVSEYGARSTQAASAQRKLNAELKNAPSGTLALLQNVKSLGNEWDTATKKARGYLVQTANYAIGRVRSVLPQIGGMVNANTGAVASAGRGLIDRLLDPSNLTILERVSATFRRDLPPAADALANMVLSFGRLTADAGPFVHSFLAGFDRWTQRLDIATRDTGYMQFRMAAMVREFRNWIRFLEASGHLLMQLFRAATVTGTSLHGITQTLNAWTRWMRDNPLKMQRFFQNSSQASGDLGKALMFVVRVIALLATHLDPLWQSLRSVLGTLGGPLLALLTQVAQTLAIIGGALGTMGGPLAIMLRVLSSVLSVLNVLLSRIPLLATVLAGALTVAGLIKMVTWMGRFVGLIPKGQTEMAGLTVATNAAAAATERLVLAQRMGGGGFIGGGGVPTVLGRGERVSGGGVILPTGVRSVAGGEVATVAEAGLLSRMMTAGRAGGIGAAANVGRAAAGARFAGVGAGLVGRLGLGSLRGLAGTAGIAALIGSTALSMIPGVPRGVQRYASNIGTGAAIGATAGSFIPLIGTGIGAGLGALGGGLYTLFSGGGGGDSRFSAYQRALTGGAVTVGGHRGITGYRPAGRAGVMPIYGTVGGRQVQRAGLNDQLARFGGDSAHTAAQISGQLGVLQRFRRMIGGDRSTQAQAALASLNQQIQERQAVLPGVRQQEHHQQFMRAYTLGGNLMRGFNVVQGAQGPAAGMDFVREQALKRWARLGPEGKRVLAQGLLSWADQMRHANPALAGEFETLKRSVIGKFVEINGAIHMVHGQILTGTQREWRNIASAMMSPVEQAREQITANLTIIQQKAVGSLQAMGFSGPQALALVRSMESGGSMGSLAGSVASGRTSYGAYAATQSPMGAKAWVNAARGGPSGSVGREGMLADLHPGIRSLGQNVLSRFPALTITSALRSGDTGSYHSLGEAIDVAGPGMASAARWIQKNLGGSLLEGIHNSGLSVKNGQVVDPSFWGASTWAQHANHIHLAIGDQGGTGGGARGGMPGGGRAGLLGLASLSPGLSGLRGLPGLLTDSTGLLVAGATAGRVNSILRGQTARTGARAASATASSDTQKLGQQMAAARGWTGNEWNALYALWQGESGWNPLARNAGSGAFGIPQALPASKMGAAAVGGNAGAQIAWGMNYIAGRYGSPSNAYSTWLSRSPHWYGNGGRFIARRPQIIGVGDKQDEEVTVRPIGHGARNAKRGGLATGGGINVQVTIGRIDATGPPGAIREQVRNEIRDAIADVASELDRTGFAEDEVLL